MALVAIGVLTLAFGVRGMDSDAVGLAIFIAAFGLILTALGGVLLCL